jgi:DNA (cytosine-5)-methyltransferase 3A
MTVTEWERLQTLPEGYTEGKGVTARCRAIGNAWTLEVIKHIFKNLK